MPTINQIQTVEPVLTGILTAYQQAATRFVASRVFPAVPVDTDSGSFLKLTKRYWFRDGLQPRAPGDPFSRVDLGTESDTFKTLQWAADEAIADEVRANSTLPLDLERARALADRHGQAVAQLMLMHVKRDASVRELMTPEQRMQFDAAGKASDPRAGAAHSSGGEWREGRAARPAARLEG